MNIDKQKVINEINELNKDNILTKTQVRGWLNYKYITLTNDDINYIINKCFGDKEKINNDTINLLYKFYQTKQFDKEKQYNELLELIKKDSSAKHLIYYFNKFMIPLLDKKV